MVEVDEIFKEYKIVNDKTKRCKIDQFINRAFEIFTKQQKEITEAKKPDQRMKIVEDIVAV